MWVILITLRTTDYLTKSLVLGMRNPGSQETLQTMYALTLFLVSSKNLKARLYC